MNGRVHNALSSSTIKPTSCWWQQCGVAQLATMAKMASRRQEAYPGNAGRRAIGRRADSRAAERIFIEVTGNGRIVSVCYIA